MIDDNGDGRGTPVEKFKGLRAEAVGKSATPDGEIAREIYFLTSSGNSLTPQAKEERAKLELAIDALRKRKAEVPEKEYYDQLEKLMLGMAEVYGIKGNKD